MIIANNLRITNTNVLIPFRVKMRGEWGMGNGEWGMGNGEWGMGHGEWGMAGKMITAFLLPILQVFSRSHAERGNAFPEALPLGKVGDSSPNELADLFKVYSTVGARKPLLVNMVNSI